MNLLHALNRYVPHFIATAASSPFYQGVDTCFHSARLNSISAFPLSGRAPYFLSWDGFCNGYFTSMKETGVVSSMKDFYWDIRPKPKYGTIELLQPWSYGFCVIAQSQQTKRTNTATGVLEVCEVSFSESQLPPTKTTELDFKGRTSINSVTRQKPSGGRQITVAGMMAYTALWALIIGFFRHAVKLQQGTHTINQALLSNTLMLIVTGLLFVAIGLPITLVVGRMRKAVPISLGYFLVGFIAIPMLITVLVTLGMLGIINLDF